MAWMLGDGQGGLAYWDSQGCEESDTTDQPNVLCRGENGVKSFLKKKKAACLYADGSDAKQNEKSVEERRLE